MSWLIWKEYRVKRLILFVGLGMMLTPHAIALVSTYFHPQHVDNYFMAASMFSLVVTQLILAMLGGTAIAGERADRSAEFLETLPFSRKQNFCSKLVFGPLTIFILWAVNLPILWLSVPPRQRMDWESMLYFIVVVAVTGLTFYCVGWFFSSLLNSAVVSSCLGLITPLAVIMGIQGGVWLFDRSYDIGSLIWYWYVAICIVISLISFPVGSLFYLRRVGP